MEYDIVQINSTYKGVNVNCLIYKITYTLIDVAHNT